MHPPTFSRMTLDQAERVTSWMDDVPRRVGNWKLERFTITVRDAQGDALRSVIQHHKLGAAEVGLPVRCVPPGVYTAAKRLPRPDESTRLYGVPEPWVPVMTDTPDELRGHRHFVEVAEGNVLVTGLGLGCVVAALATKQEVTGITVVEVDQNVIDLTGPYYRGVANIVHASAGEVEFPANTHFDYAWHDIWTNISPHNIDDDSRAEHGLSYETLFSKFAPIVSPDRQFAWAYEEAVGMRECERRQDVEAAALAEKFNAASLDERVEMLLRHHAAQPARLMKPLLDHDAKTDISESTLDELRTFYKHNGMYDRLVRACRSDMSTQDALVLLFS